jgi:hypothetical protein
LDIDLFLDAVCSLEGCPSDPKSEKLAVRQSIGGKYRERKIYNLAPIGVGMEYGVHNADEDTALRAIVTRVFLHKTGDGRWERPYRPCYNKFVHFHGAARRALLKHTRVVKPLTTDQFISAYTGRKRLAYEKARDSLAMKPLELKDSFVSSFVKAEKLCITPKDDKSMEDEDKYPRIIQPRSTRYNLSLGVYTKACEHVIYGAIDEMWGGPTVMKGLNADERGQAIYESWKRFKCPVAVGLDAHRFDQHVSQAALRFEHSLYRALFGIHDKCLAWMLQMQLNTRGFVRCCDSCIMYHVHGGR